jgi:hypothetical protein
VSEYDYSGEDFTAYQEPEPVDVATLVQQAVAQQTEALQPLIAEYLQEQRAAAFNLVADQGFRIFSEQHPESEPYRDAIGNFLNARDGFIPEADLTDPRLVAARLEEAYRLVKPAVDQQNEQTEWNKIKAAGTADYWQERVTTETDR